MVRRNTTPTYPVVAALLTTKQVADALAISATSVRRLAAAGQLETVKLGGSVRFRVGEIEELVRRGTELEKGEEPAVRPTLQRHADVGGGHGTE